MTGTNWICRVAILPMLLLANTSPDTFDRVMASLASGSAAERSGKADAMVSAASALFREGARPLDDSPDVAIRWQSFGRSGGGKSRAALAPYRDRALGAGYRMVALPAGATTQFDQIFLAGQRARVAVVPITKSVFGLSVRDDQRQPVCVGGANAPRCDWIPNFTTRYEIRLSNPGKVKSDYYVVMQ